MLENPSKAATEPVAYHEPTVCALSDLEHVRTRPGMYIGGLNSRGLHHLVWELVDNSLRESAAGFGRTMGVTVHTDGSCTVADGGRGIPVGPNLERVFDTLGAGGNLHGDAASVYGAGTGLAGVGVAVVNFMSESFTVQFSRDGRVHQLRYERGVRAQPLVVADRTSGTGTRITFQPDRSLFKELTFDRHLMADRLRELAALHAGVELVFEDDRVGHRDVFRFGDGPADFVRHLTAGCAPITGVVAFRRADPVRRIAVDGALQYVDRPGRAVQTFVNDWATTCGTHVDGFNAGLGIAFDRWATATGVLLGRDILRAGGLWRGLVGVVSVRMAEPSYRSCRRDELENPEVKGIVAAAVAEQLCDHLRARPGEARAVTSTARPPAGSRNPVLAPSVR